MSYAPLRRWARRTGAQPGPYDELGPVFIHLDHCGGPAPELADGVIPEGVRGELRVLRAYSAAGSIVGGRLIRTDSAGRADDPDPVEAGLAELYRDPAVAAVHLRAVEFGCFLMETQRAETPAG